MDIKINILEENSKELKRDDKSSTFLITLFNEEQWEVFFVPLFENKFSIFYIGLLTGNIAMSTINIQLPIIL